MVNLHRQAPRWSHRLAVLYARVGRLDDARRHWETFSETYAQPGPGVAHLVDEARAAVEEAERKAK